jgi:hypothetical protein
VCVQRPLFGEFADDEELVEKKRGARKKLDKPAGGVTVPNIDVDTQVCREEVVRVTACARAQAAMIEDVAARVALSSTTLPSVACFTFLNTHESLHAVALAPDGVLVAAGFGDSSIKLWDVAAQVHSGEGGG